MPKNIKIAIALIVLFILTSTLLSWFKTGKDLYNNSTLLEYKYANIEKDQIATWDAHYLNFIDQNKNAEINKETFLQVTQIIMSNRKDGQNLAWKWTQENTQIPYEQFVDFYKQISSFISQRYSENLRIEREKLAIVEQQNIMLKTFPNNVFNYFINIKPLIYNFGTISDSSKNLFKLK